MSLRRFAAKADRNQPEIVAALKDAGATVRSLAAVGEGFPDLAAGFRGRTFLLEVKRPKAKGQPEGALTDAQKTFFDEWEGQAAVVRTVEEALRAIGAEQ